MNIKAVILAGGLGSRISEETHLKPKPMIEIGGKPILWHIMKIYSHWGINDFVICCGYKGYVIKEYFANYFLHTSDITFDMAKQTTEVHENTAEPWRVTLVDTGESTNTGGRLRRIARYIAGQRFCLTYGDGVANINIQELMRFHQEKKGMITVTVAQPPGRYGSVSVGDDGMVGQFIEKPQGDGGWINAGFMIVEPGFIDRYTSSDLSSLENEGLHGAALNKHLPHINIADFGRRWTHKGIIFHLNSLWSAESAPWKVWTGHKSEQEKNGEIILPTLPLLRAFK